MRRCLGILREAEASRGRGTLVVRAGDSQIASGIVEVTVLHESSARSVTAFRVASDHSGKQLRTDQSARFGIVRADDAFVISFPGENFICLIGSPTRSFPRSILSAR